MDSAVNQAVQQNSGVSQTIGNLVVTKIQDDLSWGQGSIQPQAGLDDEASQQALLETVVAHLREVTEDELAYSSCTDGRIPVRLVNGEPVPVRQQTVGTDTMVMFHMAEALGNLFYKDPAASLRDRLREVVTFMQANGLVPCTHIGCGAAAGYVAIVQNLATFTADPQFIAREQAILPEGVYDPGMRDRLTRGYSDRLEAGRYDGWSAEQLMEIIQEVSGGRAIAELQDDGRGVHGHVEEQIIRVQVEGVAINEAAVAADTGGREVFGVNDTRLQRLARLMGRGQDADYRLALMAAEDFTDGGHGTLAKYLPTYVIRSA
jgi:hypothetical protein